MMEYMYRVAIFLLSVFSLTLVVLIASVASWQDYRAHGDISFTRIFQSVFPGSGKSASPGDEIRVESSPIRSAETTGLLPQVQSEFLYLINSERVRAQVPPLVLGANASAQQHADNMMAYGYRSHWDIYGLTSQMRYTLAGGSNRMMENITGPVQRLGDDSQENDNWRDLVGRIHLGFMLDQEGRANILDPWHRKVSVGFSCGENNCWVVQQFEGDLVRFSALPTIRGSSLGLSGELAHGFSLDGVAVWFHPTPRRLGLGQLDATYHYGSGQAPATFLRPAPLPEQYYPYSLVSYHWDGGIDPYSLDPGLSRNPAPPLRVEVAQSAAVPWTTASRWEQEGQFFRVEADLSPTLRSYGPGVYTVEIWGSSGTDNIPLTNYTVFVP